MAASRVSPSTARCHTLPDSNKHKETHPIESPTWLNCAPGHPPGSFLRGYFSSLHKARPQSKRRPTKTGKPDPAGTEEPRPPEHRAQTRNSDPREDKRGHRLRVQLQIKKHSREGKPQLPVGAASPYRSCNEKGQICLSLAVTSHFTAVTLGSHRCGGSTGLWNISITDSGKSPYSRGALSEGKTS